MISNRADPEWRLGREVRLVCLDLDDTIIDTERTARQRIADAVGAARRLLGTRLTVEIAASIAAEVLATDPIDPGRFPVLLRLLAIDRDHPHAAAIRKAYNARLVELLALFEGATETLAALRERYTVAIVTNGPVALQEAKLGRFGLPAQVDHVVISEAFGFRKPDARIFHHACALAGVTPEQAVHVGNSLVTDIAGARGAGLGTIWVRQGDAAAPGSPPPDAIIRRLAELRALLLD